jgi:hypothetical protein
MSAHHPAIAGRALRTACAFGGQRFDRMARTTAIAGTMGLTRALWVCDPTRARSLAPRSDADWEVDSMAEVEGR